MPLPRWAAPVLSPSPTAMRALALAGLAANAAIVATGAAVRLSNSGLGCADWPTCTKSSLVAAGRPGEPLFHTWIEFGNRSLTGVLELIAALVLIAAWRYRPGGATRRRTDLVLLAACQPGGVAAQAVIGGILVLTNLNPFWVSVHFLASAVVIVAAMALYVRCGEGTGPVRPLARPEVRVLAAAYATAVFVMLAAGTVVTGTGPLAGAPGVPRYHLRLPAVTQVHADIGWLLGGLLLALALSLRLTGAPAAAVRLGYALGILTGLQGALGYTQYFTHLPAGLVWVHVSVAVVIWILALRLVFALRERGTGEPGQTAGPERASLATRG